MIGGYSSKLKFLDGNAKVQKVGLRVFSARSVFCVEEEDCQCYVDISGLINAQSLLRAWTLCSLLGCDSLEFGPFGCAVVDD